MFKCLAKFVVDVLKAKSDYYRKMDELYRKHGSKVYDEWNAIKILNYISLYADDLNDEELGVLVRGILTLNYVETNLRLRRIRFDDAVKMLDEVIERIEEVLEE